MDGNTMDENTTDELSSALSDHRDPDEGDETATLFQDTDDDQAERLLYVEALLRNHLKFISYPILRPPDDVDAIADPTTFLRIMAELLGESGNVIAEIMITAALHVADTDGDETAIVEEFLQSAVASLMDDTDKGVEFIHAVFGELIQRETEGGSNQADLSDEESTLPGFPLSVFIGNETIPLDFDQVLPFFWSPDDRLVTDCHACALPFVGGDPPIRTINIAMGYVLALGVRVFNRHFACMKDNHISFVPVSHVWTDSIRQANMDRAHNDAAATKLIRTLMSLGTGAEGAYDREVEFWHDYFSVPQWQPDVKEQLLVRLPAIYHLPDEILVHLGDVASTSVQSLFDSKGLYATLSDLIQYGGLHQRTRASFLELTKVLPHIQRLLQSEWMTRMWVMLEYFQCRAASVMTKEGHIHRLLDLDAPQMQTGRRLYARNSFSKALAIADHYLPDMYRYASATAVRLHRPKNFIEALGGGRLFFIGGVQPILFLGKAVKLVAGKQCQYSRDKFIALGVLLDGQRTSWLPAGEAVLPGPEAEACAHIWLKALRQGDWVPLLLQPRECIPGSNPPTQSGLGSWLVGHSGLEGVEWGYGEPLTPPNFLPVVTDEGVISASLIIAGEIEEICYLPVDVAQVDTVDSLVWALHYIYGLAKAEGMELSPELLGDGLQRIFPFPDDSGDNLWHVDRLFSITDVDRRDPERADLIRCLLTAFDGAADKLDAAGVVAQAISLVLDLEEGLSGHGKYGKKLTRLVNSLALGRSRMKRGAKGGDPICKVRCPECRRVTPFRLDLRETGGVGQTVYHIPGLTYSESIKNGVGLVIDGGGRITGRMFYGPPACDCRLLVEVEIH